MAQCEGQGSGDLICLCSYLGLLQWRYYSLYYMVVTCFVCAVCFNLFTFHSFLYYLMPMFYVTFARPVTTRAIPHLWLLRNTFVQKRSRGHCTIHPCTCCADQGLVLIELPFDGGPKIYTMYHNTDKPMAHRTKENISGW